VFPCGLRFNGDFLDAQFASRLRATEQKIQKGHEYKDEKASTDRNDDKEHKEVRLATESPWHFHFTAGDAFNLAGDLAANFVGHGIGKEEDALKFSRFCFMCRGVVVPDKVLELFPNKG
jgi:hypothetical protein